MNPPAADPAGVYPPFAQVEGKLLGMATVHIPYTLEQGEDGLWCAHADFVTDEVHGGAAGEGATVDEAIEDLHDVLVEMVALYGMPRSAVRPMVLDVA